MTGALVISHFGLEGWIWVLIVSVPDHCLSLSHTFTVLAPVELRFIPNLLVDKVGVNRDESGWKKRKIQHQYGVSRCSYGVCKIRLRFHYDSCPQRYDSPRWRYECSRMLTVRPRLDTVLQRFKPVAPRQLDVINTPIQPDSSRMLKNGHDSIHGATKNEPDSATVALRFRPRPQSTTIHPNVLNGLKLS